MFQKLFLLTCGVAVMALAGCNSGSSTTDNSATAGNATNTSASTTPAAGGEKLTIAVIPKGTTHSYWKSLEAGARKAGADLGVDIEYKGPLKESDRASQISIMQQFTSDKVSGIVLAPLDDVALVNPVKAATAAGIPVVIVDSALNAKVGTDYAAFVSTNNLKGGQLAGDRMAKLLNNKGKVVLMRYQEGSASTHDREEGFLSAIKKYPGITITVDNRYAGATAGEAKGAALQMSDKLQEADGIFTPNESSTVGMLLALKQLALTHKAKFVGFDSSDPLMEGLKADEIQALVVQNPTLMGEMGVKTAVAAIKHEKFEANFDTGVVLVDKTNLNTPDVQKVLGGK